MTKFELQFYIVITYLSYFTLLLICHSKQRKLSFIGIALFTMSSLVLRLNVPISSNADYSGYYNLIFESFSLGWSSILSEPYLPSVYRLIDYFVGDNDITLFYTYISNYIMTLIFFVWLAHRNEIKLWIKISFFSFAYIFFTYTVLRNCPAYILFTLLIYYLLKNKRFVLGYFSILAHASSLPAILASFLGFKKPSFKRLILIFLGAFLFSLVITLPIFNSISHRIDSYTSDTVKNEFGSSIFHKIYFVAVVTLSFMIFKYKKKAVYNNFYLALLVVYVILHILNPVMAFRFSFYIIIYLVVYPFYGSIKYDKFLNLALGILMFFLFVNIFYNNNPYLRLVG